MSRGIFAGLCLTRSAVDTVADPDLPAELQHAAYRVGVGHPSLASQNTVLSDYG